MVSRIVLIAMVVAVSACSVPAQRPPVTPAPTPPEVIPPTRPEVEAPPEPDGSARAVQGLLQQAREARILGSFARAQSLLRRAQRIAPRDGKVYLEYARLHDSMGESGQASAMAERGLLYCDGQTCRDLRQLVN